MKNIILLLVILLSQLMASCVVVPARHDYYSPYDEDDDLPILFHRGHHFHSHHDRNHGYGHDHHGSYRGDRD